MKKGERGTDTITRAQHLETIWKTLMLPFVIWIALSIFEIKKEASKGNESIAVLVAELKDTRKDVINLEKKHANDDNKSFKSRDKLWNAHNKLNDWAKEQISELKGKINS